jgi:MoaA/NifB/PqqE/SkfB family radical SAM enzyme
VKKLRFRALVLETTDRCNAKCAMCYQAAGPRGSDLRGDSRLEQDVVLRVIGEAAALPEVAGRLHISGGEAFLRYPETLAAFRHGRDCGFTNIGSTTNGFWAVSESIAVRRCDELIDAGVDYLEVSLDHWHLPYVPVKRVRNLLRAARATGLTVILRTLTSRSHHLDTLFESFEPADLIGVLIGNGRVHPVGRGAVEVDPEDVYFGDGPVGACEDLLSLTIAPNGNVYPCCAGADMTDSLASGNVNTDSLRDAVFKMRTDRTIRQVIHQGTGSLIPIIKELGHGDRLKDRYDNICHLCWDVFKDDELAGALRGYFAEIQVREMLTILDQPPEPAKPA